MLAKCVMDWKIHYLDSQDMSTHADAHEHTLMLVEEMFLHMFWDIMSRRIVES